MTVIFRTLCSPAILCVMWLSLAPFPAYAAFYYVAPSGSDQNPGTESQPWKTIGKAAGAMTAGDTVYIRAGTYGERVIPANSGSAGSYIVYSAYPGETVTIDGSGIAMPPELSGLAEISGRSYIRVSGLRIVNAGPNPENCGILVDNSSNIIIEKNYTYNTKSSGIGVWGGSNVTIDANEVVLACNDGQQECITVGGTQGFVVRNNHVHDSGPGTNGGEGIDAKDGALNGKIHGNHVHHISRKGIYLDAWDKSTGNIEVYGNLVHDCPSGISLASEMGGTLSNVVVFNNIVYNNSINGLEIGNWGEAGISTRPVEHVTFINNTVHNNGQSSGWGGGITIDDPDIRNVVVRNNIFSDNNSFQILRAAAVSGQEVAVDHNIIFSFRGYEDEIRGTDYVDANPLYVNSAAGDFHLQPGSPAIDRGSQADAPSSDYQGLKRPQGRGYEIGAFEYDSKTGRSLPGIFLILGE